MNLRWPFRVWLLCFYSAWALSVVFLTSWDLVFSRWPIAASMALGSYFAGSTPMGGGTVGFPVLVLLFNHPTAIGRDFSFAVQSVGMVSASIYILSMRQRIAWQPLLWGGGVAAASMPFFSRLAARSLVPESAVKLLFSIAWCSFGLIHFLRLRDITGSVGDGTRKTRVGVAVGIASGIVGAFLASLTGVGIDMVFYTLSIALLRMDMKVAVPSSVMLMAFTSLVGFGTFYVQTPIAEEVYSSWFAAAPIVAIGAPLGTLAVQYLSRFYTILIVSALCVMQFIWTCSTLKLTGVPLMLALAGVLGAYGLFHGLFSLGARLQRGKAEGPRPRLHELVPHFDEVTGLQKYAALRDGMRGLVANAARHERDISLVAASIRDAEAIVRRSGPLGLEAAMRALAEAVKSVTRAGDLASAVDGSKVVVMLPDADRTGAEVFVSRLQQECNERLASSTMVAFGVAAARPTPTTDPGTWVEEALEAAIQRARDETNLDDSRAGS